MLIISKLTNPSGAYPAIQTWGDITPPPSYAEVPATMDTADFYAYNGFVTLTIEEIEHIRQVEKTERVEKTRQIEEVTTNESGEEVIEVVTEIYYETETKIVDESYTVDTVTAYEPNVEAWEAWNASLPAPAPEPEPEPTFEDDAAAMLVDHEYRLALLEAGLF